MAYKGRPGSAFDRDYYLLVERNSPYDDSFVGRYRRRKTRFLKKILLMLLVVLFLGICYLTFIFNYKSPYIYDPIESTRANFLDTQFCAFAFSSILLLIINTKRKISKKMLPLFLGVFICLISVVGITINKYSDFKEKYNEKTFPQMYSYNYMRNMNLGIHSREIFVSECNRLNEYFKMKVITIAAGQYIMVLVSGAFCLLEVLHRKQYNRLEHENEILFDEKENIM